MSIQERKTKTGISFRITAYDGYKIDKNGNYRQLKPLNLQKICHYDKLER